MIVRIVALALALACAPAALAQGAPSATAPLATGSVGTGPAGWQPPLASSLAPPPGEGDEGTLLAWVPGTGYVRGNREALLSIGRPLVGSAGRGRIVEACRGAVEAEARKIGAILVEAVPAGRERRERDGRTVGEIDVRITYARSGGHEVRLARLSCTVGRQGQVLDTSPAA